MNKSIKSKLFQAPAILVLIISFFASIYAKITGMVNSWGPVTILFIVIALYFYGRYLENKDDFSF